MMSRTLSQCLGRFNGKLVETGISMKCHSPTLFHRCPLSRVPVVNLSSPAALDDVPLEKEKVKKKRLTKKLKAELTLKAQSDVKTPALSGTGQLIINYIENHCGAKDQRLISLIPRRFLKSTTILPTSVYLIQEATAKTFSRAIQSENIDKDAPILELHPGLGLLTSELINELGFKHVSCLEDCRGLAENIASQYNVSVIDCGMDELPIYHHLDKHDGDGGDRINSILSSITTGETGESEKRTGTRKKPLYIVGAVPNIKFINFVTKCYVTKRVFFEDDLPWSGASFFVALGAKAAHICTATPKTGLVAYRPTSVFFQTLFTYKELGTVPRKAFIPWETIENTEGLKGPRKKKLTVEDPTVLKLMLVEINHKVAQEIGKENLLTYWHFVRQNLQARTNRIIPELEKWIPGCGVKLIKQGFTIYSQFGELSPNEILQLYLQFVSWPEFDNTSFLNAVESVQSGIELTEEDGK